METAVIGFGISMMSCWIGYRNFEYDCGSKYCASGKGGLKPYCAESDVDEQCKALCPQSGCTYCADNTVVECRNDHRYKETTCGMGYVCDFDDDFVEARCKPL